jgi:hypothetical protein
MQTPYIGCPICLFVQNSKTRIWCRALPESSVYISAVDLRELICNRFALGNVGCLNTTNEAPVEDINFDKIRTLISGLDLLM